MDIERYYFPDPNGLNKEVLRGLVGGDGSETTLRQPHPRVRCHETPGFQRIEAREINHPKYFRTTETIVSEGGSKGVAKDFQDLAPYAYWRKQNG